MKGKQKIRNSVNNEKKFIESYLNMKILEEIAHLSYLGNSVRYFGYLR